ncbi:hypothetical protein GQ43DRAFT_272365 [Delitschia confertaspora ATCC 74209]|uniref:Arrestin C-terminal-like domain-containing protein n=1 Tax=Delitschia confertaspora ATCC 74209 TaxID=1513339 RepID=A0A9P4JGC8_9PLEO|nr:hypothetical protein GQ43DRAFT_272365 [Delitschia confertaspora ATCC 74209]
MLRSIGISGARPVLEIKPDSSFIVFQGPPSEGRSTELSGKLVMNLSETVSVKNMRLLLWGERKVSWLPDMAYNSTRIHSRHRFLHHEIHFDPSGSSQLPVPKNKSYKIHAGSHSWEFNFNMPSTLDESVEGIPTSHVIYGLTAWVDTGFFGKTLKAKHHIRVIRTPGPDTMDMEQISEDIWASKLAYKITIPQRNYIVGTAIPVNFTLIPLRKGIEIGKIVMELVETTFLQTDIRGPEMSKTYHTLVAHMEGEMPSDSLHLVPDGVEDVDQLFDEAHRFQLKLELPKSLTKCRQDVDAEFIKISHKLKIRVFLHNPEGHTSELTIKHNIHLFISPHLPPNDDQSVRVDENLLALQAAQDEADQNAPPLYGMHQLDELYSDIDPSGFMTPRGTSGTNTPFYGHSRHTSVEDLPGLMLHSDPGASAAVLQSRLRNLSLHDYIAAPEYDHVRPARYAPSRHPSSGSSTPGGYFAGAVPGTEHAPGYDMMALTRTPSYNTAVRTPVRTPISEDLPTYEFATSRPPSPIPSSPTRHSTPSPRASPRRVIDPLDEETERNTVLNSRRVSPTSLGLPLDERR